MEEKHVVSGFAKHMKEGTPIEECGPISFYESSYEDPSPEFLAALDKRGKELKTDILIGGLTGVDRSQVLSASQDDFFDPRD